LQTILVDHKRVRAASFAAIGFGTLLLLTWCVARGPMADAIRALQTTGVPPWQLDAYDLTRARWLSLVLIRACIVLAAGGLGLTLFEIRSQMAFAWIALILLDLFLAGRALDLPSARGFYDQRPESLVQLKESLDGHRVFTPRSTDQLGNFLYGATNPTAFDWAREAMLCNANLPLGIAQAHGCDPLSPRRHDAFVQLFDAEDTPWEIKERIFDLWDASLLLTVENVAPSHIPQIAGPAEGIVHNRHDPKLGRASLMTGWETIDEPERLLGKLFSPRHDPGAWTLLEAAPGATPPTVPTKSPTQAADSMPYEAGPNSIQVAWHLGDAGMLRVLESWAPGWEATVNGQAVPIYRADFLFMAVPVPAGTCEVHFTYRPTNFPLGLVLTLVGLVVIGVFWFSDRKAVAPTLSG
jgi:hypothetical protein